LLTTVATARASTNFWQAGLRRFTEQWSARASKVRLTRVLG
jgi:hypothetical protein